MTKKTISILLLIIAASALMRGYLLTDSPEGLYIDEASIGFNAYSVLTTGKDEHGAVMPLFFEAFGEWKLPVYIYLVTFAQVVVGPTDLSVRLPSYILGLLTIPVLFLLVRELFQSDTHRDHIGVFAAAILGFSPWHFIVARPGFEANTGLFFITCGTYIFLSAARKTNFVLLLLSGINFVLSLYTYNSARLVVPCLLIFLLIWKRAKFSLLKWLLAGILLGILMIPFIKFALSPQGNVRAQQLSIFALESDVPVYERFLRNYFYHFSPYLLFVYGNPTIANDTRYRFSLLYLIDFPLLLLGIISFFKKRTGAYWFVLYWWMIALVPSAITRDSPHSLRFLCALIPMVIVIALGLNLLLNKAEKRLRILTFCGYSIGVFILLVHFLDIYHNQYAPNAGWDWQVDIKRMAKQVKKIENQYDAVYFQGAARVTLLWYLKVEPSLFLAGKNKNQVGKYVFGLDPNELPEPHGKTLYVMKDKLVHKQKLMTIYYPNMQEAYSIWED